MRERLPLSGHPRAAARQALDSAGYSSEPVDLVYNGELDGVHHKELTVTVQPGASPDDVVTDMRAEAQNQQPR